jgi:hypothetical protein
MLLDPMKVIQEFLNTMMDIFAFVNITKLRELKSLRKYIQMVVKILNFLIIRKNIQLE